MNLVTPELPPDERIRRRHFLDALLEKQYLTQDDARLWGFTALVDGRIEPPILRMIPENGGLTKDEQEGVLRLIQEGCTWSLACSRLEIPVIRYRKECKTNRDFSNEIGAALNCTEGIFSQIVVENIVQSRDTELALAAMKAFGAKRVSQDELDLKRREMTLKEKMFRSQYDQIDLDSQDNTCYHSFNMLNKREFTRYRELNDLAVAGRAFTVSEYEEYGQLVYAIVQRSSVANKVETVESGFKKLGYNGNGHNGNGSNGNGNGNGVH